ncbi:MAG: response regulator [Magnetovibrio sp.]|nr:response regulator [Magnetovibrio sp.]
MNHDPNFSIDLNGTTKHKFSRQISTYMQQVTIMGTGILILFFGILTLLYSEGTKLVERDTPLLTASINVQVQIGEFHLWFEEMLQGDASLTEDAVWAYIDVADDTIHTMLAGSVTPKSVFPRLEDPQLIPILKHTEKLIHELKGIATSRLQNRASSLAGSQVDQRFDSIYLEIVENSKLLTKKLSLLIDKRYQQYRVLIIVLGGIAFIIFILGGWFFLRLERHRQAAEHKLNDANKELDLTVQKRTKELGKNIRELNFQKLAVDEHAIVSITDVKGNITYTNDKFCQISGYSRDELLGQNHRVLLSDEHPPEFFADMWKTIANGKVWQGEIKNKHKIKGYYWVRTTIVPNLNAEGKPFQYTGIRTEITENKTLEANLALSKIEADNSNQAKSEFLSSMSHELRTPMNAILGFAQMLEFNPKEPLTQNQKTSVTHIMKGGQHLLDLINQVLDLAKIEAGEMGLSIEDVSFGTILDECLPLIQTMADDRGIQITVKGDFHSSQKMRADHTRLRQALLNLMSNAVKYNRQNGKIIIDCRDTRSAMFRISITDTGEGISKNKQHQLFKPFSRLGAKNTEIEGTGIGLTITKKIIEGMDGRIGVDSEFGVGSTFWIELPLSERKLIDVEDTGIHDADDAVKRLPDIDGMVLYVEDNPANLQLMEMIIESIEGLSMVSAHNAELGIELAKSNKPDIIILDINLPGMDGFAALKTLQGLENTQDIPVVALSANAMPKDIRKGIEAGFNKYLTKPIKVDEVVSAIKDLVKS